MVKGGGNICAVLEKGELARLFCYFLKLCDILWLYLVYK